MQADYDIIIALPYHLLSQQVVDQFRTLHSIPMVPTKDITPRAQLVSALVIGAKTLDGKLRDAIAIDDYEYVSAHVSRVDTPVNDLAIHACICGSPSSIAVLLRRGADNLTELRKTCKLHDNYELLHLLSGDQLVHHSKPRSRSLACCDVLIASGVIMIMTSLMMSLV